MAEIPIRRHDDGMRLPAEITPDKAAIVKPGDVLVIAFNRRLPADQADRIRKWGAARGLTFAVLDDVRDMAVIRCGE